MILILPTGMYFCLTSAKNAISVEKIAAQAAKKFSEKLLQKNHFIRYTIIEIFWYLLIPTLFQIIVIN